MSLEGEGGAEGADEVEEGTDDEDTAGGRSFFIGSLHFESIPQTNVKARRWNRRKGT